MMRPKIIFFIFLSFFVFIPLTSSHVVINEPCDTCTPTCKIGCNEGVSGRDVPVGGVNWFNYTVFLNCNVLIEVTASGWGYYNLTAIWNPEACTGVNSSDSGSYAFVSNSSLSPGTYYFRVGEESEDTCDIDVSCKVLCDECPPSSGCEIGCNQTYYDLKTEVGNKDVIKFTLNSYRQVNVEVVPHGWGYYNLTLIQDPNTCISMNNQSTAAGGTPISITNSSLPPGTYYFYVGHEDTEDLHNLTLTCSKVANDYPCLKGSDCQSGLCINGYCRVECNSTYNGSECSDSDNNYTQDGICTRLNSGWYCDKQEASYYLNEYWSDCFNTSYGQECDPDSLAGGYSKAGVCGNPNHADCCIDYASGSTNSPDQCGSEITVCDSEGGYYCDYTGDASWDAGDTKDLNYFRCDETDDACVNCTSSNTEYSSGLLAGDAQCEHRCGADANCDEQTPDDYCPTQGTFCNSTCIEIDRDTSQTACEHSSATCTPYHWSTSVQFESNQPYCCGDDTGENWLTESFDSSMDSSSANTNACCDASNDCVASSKCYSSGTTHDVDSDGDSDYCNSGTWVDCVDDSQCHDYEYCNASNDCVNHTLIIDSIEIQPSGNVYPVPGGNRSMNVTVNVTNSTSVNTCVIRIFNSTDSYSKPSIGPILGKIRISDSTTQCFGEWKMEYWRNPGDWNVSVDLNGLTVEETTVGYWEFNEASGTVAHDSSSYGNDGTLYNDTIVCSDPPTTGCPKWVDGKFGSALSFDGIDDYVNIADTGSEWNFQTFTAEFWIKTTDLSGEIMGEGGKWRPMLSNGNIVFWIRGLSGGVDSTDSITGSTINDGQWHHIAVVYENSTKKMQIYVDGSLDNEKTTTVEIYADGDNNQAIGKGYTTSAYPVNATMDEVRIYSRALTKEEINASYHSGLVSNFTSKTFNYTGITEIQLRDKDDNSLTTINFSAYPNQEVNSTNAYPMKIKNIGNLVLNVSINGTDFNGTEDSSYVIGVGNASYSETESGSYTRLTYNHVLVFPFLKPAEERTLYFKAYAPLGFKAQIYSNEINIKREEA